MSIDLSTILTLALIIWLLPIVFIARSRKTQAKEKILWILCVLFVSWFAWILYILLAPVSKATRNSETVV